MTFIKILACHECHEYHDGDIKALARVLNVGPFLKHGSKVLNFMALSDRGIVSVRRLISIIQITGFASRFFAVFLVNYGSQRVEFDAVAPNYSRRSDILTVRVVPAVPKTKIKRTLQPIGDCTAERKRFQCHKNFRQLQNQKYISHCPFHIDVPFDLL